MGTPRVRIMDIIMSPFNVFEYFVFMIIASCLWYIVVHKRQIDVNKKIMRHPYSKNIALRSANRYLFYDLLDRIDIPGPKLITETDRDIHTFDDFRNLDFKCFFFGCKRLNARIPDDSELFVRAVDHGVIQ